MISFDGPNRVVVIDFGVVEVSAIDIYSLWKQWVTQSDNAKYLQAFSAVGGEPINSSGSQSISPYFFFVNGWRLRPHEADHQLTINGNLLTDDGSQPTVPTIGNFQVFVRAVVSSNATTIDGGLSLSETNSKIDALVPDLQLARDHARAADSQTQGS